MNDSDLVARDPMALSLGRRLSTTAAVMSALIRTRSLPTVLPTLTT
jgi:hypothetical protein